MRNVIAAVTAALVLAAAPAFANDTTAKLGAGGLIFVRTDAVAMESEDLFISQEQVRVDYVFRNQSDADVDTIVAFPMPDIVANPFINVALPQAGDNFLGFSVSVDGKSVQPTLDQRAFAAEVDVTEELRAAGIPLYPYADEIDGLVAKLPEPIRKDWIARGLVTIDSYDVGSGMQDHFAPMWTLKSTYWWRMVFPKGQSVQVQHRYQPSVGGTVGLTFVVDGAVQGPGRDAYRHTYCMDAAFEKAVQRAVDKAEEGTSPFFEHWISYVLTTGGNWAGTIGKFKLTIDKGDPDSLVSFCGSDVKKTGPTTFEMTAENFYPERDIDILILKKPESDQ